VGEERPHLEPGHDGSVISGVKEVRQREQLRRLAAPEERRAALVEVPRHLRVQLRALGRHGAGAARGGGRVGAHALPAEEDDEEEGGGREEPDGGARRSGTGRAAARGPRGHGHQSLVG